eukprot:CAMPEP_0171996672 /NCGR_PEP_ID=MMETSP1041-20130122/265_1 /TAXON_ID=464988 /ORGANISM="Hemiselmis andersenii, Strain CCMP439" /LENGTH=135 /DNA_ID=CAMNT_0012649869 /DNA_START=196 /DNA_END=601 /DNA_ORIENTATION=+
MRRGDPAWCCARLGRPWRRAPSSQAALRGLCLVKVSLLPHPVPGKTVRQRSCGHDRPPHQRVGGGRGAWDSKPPDQGHSGGFQAKFGPFQPKPKFLLPFDAQAAHCEPSSRVRPARAAGAPRLGPQRLRQGVGPH